MVVACSRRSVSGERCAFFTSHCSPLSERLEQAKVVAVAYESFSLQSFSQFKRGFIKVVVTRAGRKESFDCIYKERKIWKWLGTSQPEPKLPLSSPAPGRMNHDKHFIRHLVIEYAFLHQELTLLMAKWMPAMVSYLPVETSPVLVQLFERHLALFRIILYSF